MFGIIASPDFADDIKEVLEGKTILFEKVGFFEPDEFEKICTAAAGISIDVLIVDMTCCSNVIPGVRKYRITRSSRVIVIAPGRVPGDPTISALVSDGVYDIVAPALPDTEDDEESSVDIKPLLQKQLSLKYHMGNAARWKIDDAGAVSPSDSAIKEKVIKETVIKEKIIVQELPAWPVVVSVTGTDVRSGATHFSIQAASFLKKFGTVCCVEIRDGGTPSFRVFDTFEGDEPFRYQGIDFYSWKDGIMPKVLSEYRYVVLDHRPIHRGYDATLLTEFLRSHVQIVVGGASVFDYHKFFSVLDLIFVHVRPEHTKNLSLIVNFSDIASFKKVNSILSNSAKRLLNIRFVQNVLVADPFQITTDAERVLAAIFSNVIPKETERKKFSLFSRGR